MMFVFLFLVGNFALGQFGGSTPTGQDSALLRLAPMDYFDYLMKADRPFAEAVGLAQNYIMANENRPEINRLKKRMGRFYNFWYSRMAPTERVSEANLRGIDRAVSNRCAPPNILAPAWQQLGPVVLNEEIEGRFNRVYSPQGSPTIIYAAGSAGGLFKTTNSGGDWENVTDGIGVPGLGINDMIADPSDPVNTLYIATGYLGLVFEPATSYGAGIYKTTNGGTTWILCASTANALYTKLLIAKDGTNTIIYGLTMDKLYKTTDDWQTKTDLGVMNFQPLPNNTQEIYTDMAVVPSNPYSVIVTSLGGGVSPLAHTVVCGNTAATVPAWHELVYPSHLNTNPIAMSVDRGPLTNDTRLFVCAYSYHAYPTELYAVNFDMAGNETVALPLNLQIPSESRINGEFVILPNGADPSLPIEIYLPLQASIRFIELTPSGASYNTGAIVGGTATVGASVQLVTGSMHNDFRGLDFNNVNRSTLNHTGLYEGLLVVNDGGVVRYGTYNSALIWKNLLGAATRPLTGHELYGLSLAQNKQPNGLNIFTGGVDNGSFGYRVTSGVGAWAQIGGTTDGNDPIIDWSDNTNYFYKTLATHTFYSANNNSINPGGTGWLPFYTTQDPIRPKIIIVAEKDWIKRYSYTPTTGFILLGTGSILPQTTLSGIAIAPTNSDVVYVTTSWNRTIHRSTDGGLTFAQSHDLGHAWITAVAIDPTDENQLTVATGGFNTGIAQGSCNGVEKVWHISYDPATQTFTQTDISAGICNAPINSVKYQTGANALGGAVLWAGTDMGVYRYEPSTGVWESYNTGFPYCLVNDIEIDPCEGKIYASTYGRGVWKNDLPNFSPTTFPSVSIASNVTDCEAVLTATIANQASTVHNFLWSTGEIATSPTALTNAIAVHHSGTYTVIASGGGTCVATASIAVSVFEPTVTLTSSITTPLCANTSVTLQAGVGNPSLSNAVWHWGALSSSIGSAITILPQGAGGTTSITTTYTVTVTDGATCTATGSIDITVLNNCCPVPPPFQEIQPRSATASQIAANIAAGKLLPNVAAASTAQQIVISGQSGSELVIDDDYTFFNSTIQLGTGCKITVATGKTLTLLGCTVESCGASLWDKMEVLGGGTLLIDECVYTDRSGILVRKPTTIKDGDNGIYVKEENATLAIKNAVFESNYVSIYLDGTDIQTSATLPISFQCNSTVFKGVADIGSTKIAAVHTGIHYPATGLFLLNAHISLNPISLDPTDGVISGGSTLFTDMTNGILSIDSDINLGACRFVN
ncbi:MAG: hypothetical protein RI894_1772, partial [Bacteroidota bacterium]